MEKELRISPWEHSICSGFEGGVELDVTEEKVNYVINLKLYSRNTIRIRTMITRSSNY